MSARKSVHMQTISSPLGRLSRAVFHSFNADTEEFMSLNLLPTPANGSHHLVSLGISPLSYSDNESPSITILSFVRGLAIRQARLDAMAANDNERSTVH